MDRYVIKQNDLEPSFEVQLLDGTTPVDLTSAVDVLFLMKSRKTGIKATGTMVVADQTVADNRGIVRYDWQTGDTDTVGSFNAEVQVTWPTGRPQTFPANQYVLIDVQRDLGP